MDHPGQINKWGYAVRCCARHIPVFLLLAGAFIPNPNQARAEDSREGEIRVKATAQVSAPPDEIEWTLRPSVLNMEAEKAFRECDEKVAALLAKLKELGIAQDDLQTPSVDINMEFDRSGNFPGSQGGKFVGYRVTRTLSARQRGVENFRKIYLAVTAFPDVDVRYSLAVSSAIELRAKARTEAAKVARSKAEALAAPLQAKVVRVLKIEEAESGYAPQYTNFNFSGAADAGGGQSADNGAPFAPGLINETASLYVTFKLETAELKP